MELDSTDKRTFDRVEVASTCEQRKVNYQKLA